MLEKTRILICPVLLEDGDWVCVLQYIQVPIIDKQTCETTGVGLHFNQTFNMSIPESLLCAGELDGGVDACQGDSGGPMVAAMSGGNVELVGVVSTGFGCARENLPGLYTNIFMFLDHIKSIIAPGECQDNNATITPPPLLNSALEPSQPDATTQLSNSTTTPQAEVKPVAMQLQEVGQPSFSATPAPLSTTTKTYVVSDQSNSKYK